ncbi:hypothetical protein [Nonomuraea zeae]|uniref:Uncharacterized protein n=1 Tax=Nonomuraea zeae TaxID=1642303 RepID=A0A5S4FXK4_9ACTN|nr:hypothetical protein [Nonomuraea zeae]TMR25402.1 hypothetical protein ETD85_45390 [Nonomuraea zeae]
MFAGLTLYSIVNTLVGFFIFVVALNPEGPTVAYIVAGAIILALVGLGLGAALVFMRKPWSKGMGLGLMIGWALWSILSAGICTGLNPGLYG